MYKTISINEILNYEKFKEKWRTRTTGEPFEYFDGWYVVQSISQAPYWYSRDMVEIQIVLREVPAPKPKTERQIALEQAIKIHKLNIEHNELMIQKYQEELKNESM